MITEITEKDFRKLEKKCWIFNSKKRIYENVSVNDLLDDIINSLIKRGYEADEEYLKLPITIALHKDNDKKDWYDGGFYLDKFMDNSATTIEFGIGIKHLYTSRDYYECHEDYWRVKKDETENIYRVYLKPRKFVLKHKTVIDESSKIKNEDGSITYIEEHYDLNIFGKWTLVGKSKVTKTKHRTSYESIK